MTSDPPLNSFDQDIDNAASSRRLAELFASAFDESAQEGVLGFSFVTMAGLQQISDLLAESHPRLLLDAGCGWGGPGLWIAQTIGSHLVGIDSSVRGVEIATGRAGSSEVQATFQHGTLPATRLADNSVDAAISIDALHYAPNPSEAAREILRVIRPGSMFAATLWNTSVGPERFTRDYPRALAEAGWVIDRVEDHPEWLAAQLNLYEAANAIPASGSDPAIQRLQREAEVVVPFIEHGRRLLIVATRPVGTR